MYCIIYVLTMSSKTILPIVILGIGSYFLFKNALATDYSSDPFFVSTVPPITVPGYRLDGIIASEDVGSTKVLPIIQTSKQKTDQSRRIRDDRPYVRDEDIKAYQEAPSAIDKIRASVKVLPKNRANEQASNLEKLGWT